MSGRAGPERKWNAYANALRPEWQDIILSFMIERMNRIGLVLRRARRLPLMIRGVANWKSRPHLPALRRK